MKTMLVVFTLLVASICVAQTQQPPYATPPTFPDSGRPQDKASPDKPQDRMPPDTKAPDSQRMSTTEVERQIQDKLKSEPTLQGTDVAATADDNSVKLTGTVNTEDQHEIALRIAQSYAGERKLVDKLKVQGKT